MYYSSKGFKFDYSKTVEIFEDVYTKIDYYLNTKIEYLEIPLSVQYSFGNKIKFIPSAGLYLDLLLDQYSETKPFIMPDDMESGSTELKLSTTIIGLKLRGNLSYNFSEKINLLIDIEYNNDFSKVFDYEDNELYTVNTDDGTYEVTTFGVNAESKLRSLTLMVGLTFIIF